MPLSRGPRRVLLTSLVTVLALVLTACPERDDRVAELEEDVSTLARELGEREAELEEARGRIAELEEEDEEEEEEVAREAEPIGTREGLEDALRTYFPAEREDWERGVTPWGDSDLSVPDAFVQGQHDWETPGELMVALAPQIAEVRRLGEGFGEAGEGERGAWEVTVRALRVADEHAVGIVQLWGLPDDAFMGGDWRFALARDADGWYVTEVWARGQCRRGVSDGSCV